MPPVSWRASLSRNVDGYSFEAIADRLNGMGVLSPMEYKKSNVEKFSTGILAE